MTGPWGVVWDPHVGASSVGAPLELIWIGDTCKVIGDIVTSDLAVQYYIILMYTVFTCIYILFKAHIILSWTISVNGPSLVQY